MTETRLFESHGVSCHSDYHRMSPERILGHLRAESRNDLAEAIRRDGIRPTEIRFSEESAYDIVTRDTDHIFRAHVTL